MKVIRKKPIVTYIIIGICICMYVLVNITGVAAGSTTTTALAYGAYYKPFILAGEYYRLFTVGLIHVSFWHLFMNMMALYSLGKMLEPMLGWAKFLLILLLSVISGSLWVFILDGNVLTVGLSAGLYGLMACEIYILYVSGLMKHPQIRSQMLNMILINLLINLMPGISVSGHIGGFIGGILLSCIFIQVDKNHLKENAIKSSIALGLYVVGICYFCLMNTTIPTTEQYKGTDVAVLEYYQDLHLTNHASKMIDRLDTIYGDDVISTYMKGRMNYDKQEIY